MSIFGRVRALLASRANAALARAEDPVQTLEYAYGKQLDALQDVRRGIADVLTSEKRLEIERGRFDAEQSRARAVAADALRRGDEAGARTALERAASGVAAAQRLGTEIDAVRAQREALQQTATELAARIDAMRTQKVALAARMSAANATTRAAESVLGLSDDSYEVERMVERARDRSLQIQARAAALADLAAPPEHDATRASASAWVEGELAALRDGDSQPALGSGDDRTP